MENNNGKFWAEGELNVKDAGSLISLIKEHLKISSADIANDIKTSEKNIGTSEKGGGMMGYNMLSKICKKYNLEAKIVISEMELKKGEASFKSV